MSSQPLRWFFALNRDGRVFPDYADMAKVAVHTAVTKTSLEPHMLWDGPADEPLIAWMRARGVVVHPVRSRLYDLLARIAKKDCESKILSIGAGAFLRAELPRLAANEGFGGETVLYTDCDVMFLTDPAPTLGNVMPRLFALAPESDPCNLIAANTGVMLMNLPALHTRDRAFFRFTARHLAKFVHISFDQAAYLSYYNPPQRWLTDMGVPPHLFVSRMSIRPYLNFPQWDHLAPGFNWKPYWGPPGEAAIFHFHGPKPSDREAMRPGNPQYRFNHIATEEYWRQCEIWDRALADAA